MAIEVFNNYHGTTKVYHDMTLDEVIEQELDMLEELCYELAYNELDEEISLEEHARFIFEYRKEDLEFREIY